MGNLIFISVFTPTYNRAYVIENLYKSLCRQTYKGFEWVIVDDGSTDDTETLIEKFISEQKISIRYFKQVNGGKHRAINRGVKFAKGEIFFIVDSDDYLKDFALERVAFHYLSVRGDESFAGVCGLRCYPSGEKVGGEESWSIIDARPDEVQRKYCIKGDRAEVWRTDVLRRFPFPEFDGETFCGEALVWHRIGRTGFWVRYFYEKIYVCEYLADGLTKNSCKTLSRGARASLLVAREFFEELCWSEDFLLKLKRGGNWWECVIRTRSFDYSIGAFYAITLFPVGILMFFLRYIQSGLRIFRGGR